MKADSMVFDWCLASPLRRIALSVPIRGILAACVIALAPAVAASAAGPEDDQDRLVTASELSAMVAKPTDGRAVQYIWQGSNYLVMTSVRLVPGIPERHDDWIDLFIVQDGTADVLLGGQLVGGKSTGPGETRGGQVVGGHVRTIGPGDILWIPAGYPHQVTPSAAAPFRYLAIKIPKTSALRK